MFAHRPALLARTRERLWYPIGVEGQLRVLVSSRNSNLGLAAGLRHRHSKRFDPREGATLEPLVPLLQDGFLVRRLLGSHKPDATDVAPLLDAFDQPAVLVSTRGVAAFANITARRVRSELISRLPSTNMAADRLTRRSRVLIGGSDFELLTVT